MIVEHRPEPSEVAAQAHAVWRGVAVAALFFAVTVLLQSLSGAWHSEFSGYPDESAHYVTGLMIRDYLAGMHYAEPMQFAKDYYARYPKVALGHWPPFFYIVEAAWMLIFSASRMSILLELAFLTTLIAFLMYTTVKDLYGWRAGVLAGLLIVCLPVMQVYSSEVMAESLLVLTSFAAVLYFARYLKSERWTDSLWFGVFASLAILTKGNGWDLALVPPVALILTRRYRVMRNASFWLPALVAGVLCGPWQVLTLKMAQRGWNGGDQPNMAYTIHALWAFVPVYLTMIGWGLAAIIVAGIVVTVAVPYFRGSVEPLYAAMFGLILAAWLFHSIVPAGVEARKLIVAVPALILFLFAGGEWLASWLRWRPEVIAAIVAVLFAIQVFAIPRETHYGYSEAAEMIHSRPELRNLAILVSSERDGEGMLVSELAMRDHPPVRTILRGTKVLSSTDWNGHVLERRVRTPEELLTYLRDNKVDLLVCDTLSPAITLEHQRMVRETLETYRDRFRLIGKFKGETNGLVYVYRVAEPR
jgi:hypothetical protein